jgi:hypothetical protein
VADYNAGPSGAWRCVPLATSRSLIGLRADTAVVLVRVSLLAAAWLPVSRMGPRGGRGSRDRIPRRAGTCRRRLRWAQRKMVEAATPS